MLLETVKEFISENQLLSYGDGVVIALSGGADSVCLLRVLCTMREQMNLHLLAVHVEHGIRGESACADQMFCAALCRQQGIPFRAVSADIPAMAKEKGISLEEAGRQFRYSVFESVRREEMLDKIAAAHHADDNAETVLLNLSRGTGLRGLCGMSPVSGVLIRPLLCVDRSQIEIYLNRIGQEYCMDETNADIGYARNRIRHRILPELKKINSRASEHINDSARILKEADAYLERQAEDAQSVCLDSRQKGSAVIDLTYFRQLDPLIREKILLNALETVCGRRKDIGQIHVRGLERLITSQSGRRMSLPYGMQAVRVYDTLHIFISGQEIVPDKMICPKEAQTDPDLLQAGTVQEICTAGVRIAFTLLQAADFDPSCLHTENPYTKFVDYDKITYPLKVRRYSKEDTISIDALGHHKTMHRYLIDEKVPLPDRDDILIAADGECIVWVIGGRIGYDYRLNEQTRRILKMEILGANRASEGELYDRDHQYYDSGRGCGQQDS